MSRTPRSSGADAVVSLDRTSVEWFDDSGAEVRHGQARLKPDEARGFDIEAVVRAVVRAREAAAAPLRPVVLMLGEGPVHHDLLTVPDLPKRELRRIFARKAATPLGCAPDDVLVTALAAGDGASPIRGAGRSWSTVSLRRTDATDLCLRLRDEGVVVRRMVSGRHAARAAAAGALEEPRSPAVLVGIEPASITISLVCGEAVLSQDALEGDFLEHPAIASSLIHQVKSLVGYWKKQSRGERVRQVVLFGLRPDRGELLRHAFEAALSGVRVSAIPRADKGDLAGRYAYLRAARNATPRNPNIAPSLGPRRATVAASMAAALALAAGGALSFAHHVRGEAADLRLEARGLATSGGELSALRAENARVDALTEALAREIDLASGIRAYGVEPEEMFTLALRAFHGRAALIDFDLRAGASGERRVVLTGRVGARPEEMRASLGGIRRALESSGRFRSVELTLPTALGALDGAGELEFRVNGELAAGAARES